jgi:plastocyanin
MKRLTVLLLVCALAAFGLAACGDDDDDDNGTGATTGATGTTGANGATGATGGAGGGASTLRVEADPSGALKFTKDELSAEAGTVKVDFRNPSSVPHNVSIEQGDKEIGKTKVVTDANSSTTVELESGEYTYYCEVDGHEQAGMKGTLTVK